MSDEKERAWLQANIGQMDQFLADMPEGCVIERMGFESLRKDFVEQLTKLDAARDSEPPGPYVWEPAPPPYGDVGALQARLATVEAERDEARQLAADALRLGLEAVEAMKARKAGAYAERDQCVALLARMAIALGMRAGVRAHEPDGQTWDATKWQKVVTIDLPTGQCGWHVPEQRADLLEGLPVYQDGWDGHDTEEKYRRVNACRPDATPAPRRTARPSR